MVGTTHFPVKNPFKENILCCGRYIDDVVLFFLGSEKELLDFHTSYANVKLSLEYYRQVFNFLDIKISKDDQGLLHTSILKKNN